MNSKIRICLTALLLLLLAAPAQAQRVSADLNGVVLDQNGVPVPGATVRIVHVPSGTTSATTTQANGRYADRGLRVGGPYTITASKDGYRTQTTEGVTLKLGDPEFVQLTLVTDSADAADLGSLEVVGSAVQDSVFQPDNMGTSTEVTRDQIENLPSISRSINDFVRLDPRATIVDKERGAISVAGGHNRFNSFTIDGVSMNDEFGLNDSGQPGVRGQPLSIDWVEQISIETSPYDAKQGGFTGAGISAVTKSGTNEFDFRLYGQVRNEDLVGDDENGNEFNRFDDNWFGGYVSGPIIKDKLFFFVGYEEQDQTNADQFNAPADEGRANEIINTAQTVYGFDPGAVGTGAGQVQDQGDEKIIAKVDWNVNDLHRASFRYSNLQATNQRITRNNFDFDLDSRFFTDSSELDQYSAQLFSDWNSNISTELRFSRAEFSSIPQRPVIGPQVEIRDFARDINNSRQDLRFGTEQFRHFNTLETEVDELFFNFNYFTGVHSIDAGLQFKEKTTDNFFLFSGLGTWTFFNAAGFEDGTAPAFYEFRRSADPSNPELARTLWSYDTLSLWVQDTWQPTSNLSLQFGLRYDQFDTGDAPPQNALFEQTFGLSNQGTIDGESIIQPRFGFNYNFDTPYKMQLRGGVGLFVGRQPDVWLSNAFTNNGVTIATFQCGPFTPFGNCTDLDPNFRFTPDPNNQPEVGGTPRFDVDLTEDGFRLPSDWKANLALDVQLPFWENSTFTAEVTHAQVKDGLQTEHLNLGAPTGTLPDGRLAYWGDINAGRGTRANADPNFNDVLLLKNTDEGNRTSLTLALKKNWGFDNGGIMSATVSATFNDTSDVNSGTSSRAISNWNNRAVFNPNEEIASTSNFEISNNYKLVWQYAANWASFGRTKFSAFYQHRTGRPFSWTFDNDANGDGISDNDLLYVPRGPGDVEFVSPDQEAAFLAFIESIPSLATAKGTVVGRNTEQSPDVSQIDIRIAQEFAFGSRFQGEIFFDIENFWNIFDDSSGQITEVPFEYVAELVDFRGVNPNTGKYIYNFDNGPSFDRYLTTQDRVAQSRWAAQIGIRLDF